MFDTSCSNELAYRKRGEAIPASPYEAALESQEIGVLTWEEHCVECGQPECFRTCKFYERSFDGKCKRFEFGIVPIDGLHVCAFKQWGKLEAVYTGRVRNVGRERLLAKIDRTVCSIARAINRMMAFVPGRIGAITIYRRLKLWADRFLHYRGKNVINEVLMQVWSSRDVRLHFTTIEDEHETFTSIISLPRGWSEHVINLPPIKRGTRLLLFSTEDEPFSLAFYRLDGINGTPKAQEREDEVKSSDSKTSAKFVKCVAWDLDNTIWKGILVEDGVDKLVINEEAVRVIKELDKRGIVHTVVSKNDYEPAWKALEKFGIAEYFIFPHINWLPKSGNMVAVAKEININLNTFAFVDDSSFERGEVGEKCPQVRIFNETDIPALLEKPEFNPPVSAESSGRRASYQREMKRVAAAAVFDGDYNEFLKSCKIELSFFDLRSAHEAEYERCYELIQRSNQLTLTGNRYSEDEFKVLVQRDGTKAWGIRCKDRFGDYGIIGCVIIDDEGEGQWRIHEFVMSCRVAKKGCEVMAIDWVKGELRKNKGTVLKADIVDTGRNMALREALKDVDLGGI